MADRLETERLTHESRAARNTAGLLEELEAVHAEVGFHAVKTALYHADDRVEALTLLAHFGSLDNNVSVNVGVSLGVNDLDGHFAFPLLLLEHGFCKAGRLIGTRAAAVDEHCQQMRAAALKCTVVGLEEYGRRSHGRAGNLAAGLEQPAVVLGCNVVIFAEAASLMRQHDRNDLNAVRLYQIVRNIR